MMLIEEAQVPSDALPLSQFKAHLQLATGFADTGETDPFLLDLLRSAIAAVEGRTGKALLQRSYRWTLACWKNDAAERIPISPVTAITAVTVFDASGNGIPVDLGRVQLVSDLQAPILRALGSSLPAIPSSGSVEVRLTAGFGPAWTDVPADLRQAVLLLAAGYFERRNEHGPEAGSMSFGVMALIERWRSLRTFGGRRA